MEQQKTSPLSTAQPWARRHAAHLALAAVALLSFLLNFLWIGNTGYGNAYYAAAVRSMTQSWHNFFFVSFDPAGVVSVDKPPLGLWVQALFVLAFGYHGWAMLLPQALAGAGSTVMMYRLIRPFGRPAGLVAALVFAVTPAVVVASRNNTMDMQLIFVLLLSAGCFQRAVRSARWGPLLLAAALVGVGFNIKMLQAYLVLPAMALTYVLFAPEKLWLRLVKGAACLALVAAVSLGWAAAVEWTDPGQRPYVGSSSNNSVFQLITGHNGVQRLSGGMGGFGAPGGNFGGGGGRGDGGAGGFRDAQPGGNAGWPGGGMPGGGRGGPGGNEIGSAGPLRLWSDNLFGQISWLLAALPFAGVALLRRGAWTSPRLAMAVFWGLYLLTTAAFFSFAGFYHRYYLAMMAPGIAALAGMGLAALWRGWMRREGWRQALLPLALAVTLGVAMAYVWGYEQTRGWLAPLMAALGALALAALAWVRRRPGAGPRAAAIGFVLAALLAGPAYWSLTAVIYVPQNVTLPYAGPELAGSTPGWATTPNQTASHGATGDRLLMEQYLVANYRPGSFLVMAQSANDVADFIVDTGLPAVAYGGFMGSDNAVSLEQLKEWVAQGKVTYFLLGGQGGFGRGGFGGSGLESYVRENATPVDPAEYGAGGSAELYVFGE